MKVVIYVRVSTQEQANEGYSIGEQIKRLNKYCEAMEWTIVETYIDPGYSGGNTDRPGLQQMIKDIKEGNIDKVVVYKLDRLSRSQLDTLYLIEKVFLANDTDFVSMNENFDTSTPFGRAMIGILAVFAQLEREQIKERMSMGKEARAKEGKWHGGSTEPIGYDYDSATDELIVNDYEKMQILEIYDLFIKGTPLRTIETMFLEKGYKHKHGVWSPNTMRQVMRNKIYLGYIKHKDEWYKGLHMPIIDEETYNKAVKILDERLEQFKETGLKTGIQTTYLGGLLHCKHCGGKYSKTLNSRYKEGKPKVYWYSCYSRCKKVKKMIKNPNCKNKNWKMVDLDNIIFEEIKKLAINPDYMSEVRAERKEKNDAPNKIDIIEAKIKDIDDQIARFMKLYGVGTFSIEQVSQNVDPLNKERTALKKELDTLKVESGRLTDEETIAIAESFLEIMDYGDFNEIRLIIESLINRIEIDNEDVYIHWNF